ncbi:histidine triad nucleotide-binding protein [Legionella sp. CNM-4043-24]|uniref:histidine triad nucleotide-binding protein n=1 Tax=Legionella sp. CNM-4043-24 TaxID=3421646 RepID=UPI00403B0FCE
MSCLFCKIVQKDIPATIVAETDELLAFRDIRPQASTHVLIIPKQHIPTLNEAHDEALLGRMLLMAKNLAQSEQISEQGYRLVFNVNPGGGQEVYHIHLHLLGGRQMTWPPG